MGHILGLRGALRAAWYWWWVLATAAWRFVLACPACVSLGVSIVWIWGKFVPVLVVAEIVVGEVFMLRWIGLTRFVLALCVVGWDAGKGVGCHRCKAAGGIDALVGRVGFC